MKEKVYARIETFRGQYFLDYSKNKRDWKNHSVENTYEKSLKSMESLKEFYSIVFDCNISKQQYHKGVKKQCKQGIKRQQIFY